MNDRQVSNLTKRQGKKEKEILAVFTNTKMNVSDNCKISMRQILDKT